MSFSLDASPLLPPASLNSDQSNPKPQKRRALGEPHLVVLLDDVHQVAVELLPALQQARRRQVRAAVHFLLCKERHISITHSTSAKHGNTATRPKPRQGWDQSPAVGLSRCQKRYPIILPLVPKVFSTSNTLRPLCAK